MVRNLTALLVFSATVSIASLAPGQADPGARRRATPAPEASRADAETRRAQEDLKEILAEIRGRMTSLSERLKATQPEDAKRLDEAARKIETSQLPQDLAAIIDNLTN